MKQKPTTFPELLDLWPTPKALSQALDIPYVTAQVMKHRGSVGDAHWPKIIELANALGVTITTDDLLAMKFRRRDERKARGGVAA